MGIFCFLREAQNFYFLKFQGAINAIFQGGRTKISRTSKRKFQGAKVKIWATYQDFAMFEIVVFWLLFATSYFAQNQVIWKYCRKEKKGGYLKFWFLEYLPSFSNLKFPHSYAPNQTWRIFFFEIWPFAKSKQDFAKISCIQTSKGISKCFLSVLGCNLKCNF